MCTYTDMSNMCARTCVCTYTDMSIMCARTCTYTDMSNMMGVCA